MTYEFNALAYAYGRPQAEGCLKAQNSDFRVDEIMPVTPSGQGEHLWLKIEKDGSNTDWVAQQLARWAGVKPMAVSYAGMKDRHAITTQWFSVHLPGMDDPDLDGLQNEEFRVLESVRHDRKLKLGTLSGNRFHIRITGLQADPAELEQRLERVRDNGVPNYFGEQRFGRHMSNLEMAEKMFRGELKKIRKPQRGLYLSAARSWIFNRVLSQRIEQQGWLTTMPGEVYMLNGKSACFVDDDPELNEQRMLDREINLTGPLWGEGQSMASADLEEFEREIAGETSQLAKGLEDARMKQERRSLRLLADNMSWQVAEGELTIEFELPAGAFATMLLRECVNF